MSLGLTTIVRMPRFDEHDYRGQVVELCVRSGDLVEAGHLLCRVESTRTDLEIEAPRSGRVQWSVSPGETVGVGAPLCELVHPLDDDDPAGPSPSQPRRSSAPSAPVSPTSGVPAVRTGISWTGSMRPPASPAVVVGSERHGAVVIDALLELGIRPVGVLDDAHEPGEVVHQGIEVLPHGLDYERWVREGTGAAYLGFGLGDDNRPRRDVFRGLAAAGFVLPPIVHPRASVARGVTLGPGAVVLAGAVVAANVHLGANTVVEPGATIGQDCVVGDHAHLASGVLIAAGAQVGPGASVGLGALVLEGAVIGAASTVEPGTTVISDLPPGTVLGRAGVVLAAAATPRRSRRG